MHLPSVIHRTHLADEKRRRLPDRSLESRERSFIDGKRDRRDDMATTAMRPHRRSSFDHLGSGGEARVSTLASDGTGGREWLSCVSICVER